MQGAQKYAARDIEIRVGFSHHCFTDTKTTATATTIYAGKPAEPRYFCTERYGLSKELPAIIQTLPVRTCFFAKRQNYFVADAAQTGLEYRVFFDVRNIGEADAVLVFVQSAYMASKQTAPGGKRKKVGFRVLVNCAVESRRAIEPLKKQTPLARGLCAGPLEYLPLGADLFRRRVDAGSGYSVM